MIIVCVLCIFSICLFLSGGVNKIIGYVLGDILIWIFFWVVDCLNLMILFVEIIIVCLLLLFIFRLFGKVLYVFIIMIFSLLSGWFCVDILL